MADRILGDGKFEPGYKRTFWKGCEHGFAVRGDLVCSVLALYWPLTLTTRLISTQNDPVVKAAKEAVFKISLDWINEYL